MQTYNPSVVTPRNDFGFFGTPGANTDSTQGFSMGSRILDLSTNKIYVCISATVGAAVWLEDANNITNDHATPITTNATPTTVITRPVPAGTTIQFYLMVSGEKSDNTDHAGYFITGTATNPSGTASIVGTNTTVHASETNAAWDCAVTASGGNILVRLTGAAATTINWKVNLFTLLQ